MRASLSAAAMPIAQSCSRRPRAVARPPKNARCFRRSLDDDHRAHHLVIFVIDKMAVPNIAGPLRRVEREFVLPRVVDGFSIGNRRQILWSKANDDARHVAARSDDGVLPAALFKSRRPVGTIDG